jgi:hypothetical protein
LKGIKEHQNESWLTIGAYIVNTSLNLRPFTAMSNRSQYEAYYEKVGKATTGFIVDRHLLWQIKTDVAEKDPQLLKRVEALNQLIFKADEIWKDEDNQTTDEEREAYNAEAHLAKLQQSFMDKVMVRAT